MAQNPLLAFVAKTVAGAFTNLQVDSNTGQLLDSRGGKLSVLNLTAAAVVKAGPGRVSRVIIVAPGTTSGAFTLNDCLTTGAAAAANAVWSLPFGGANNIAGATFELDWPFAVGVVLSAVPGAGSPIIAVSYS